MSLVLSVPTFSKKYHRTRNMETFKLWPNFESFHSSCPMGYFVENRHTMIQGHQKNALILYVGVASLAPFHTA